MSNDNRNEIERATKATYDRMQDEQRKALTDAGVPYEKADRQASKNMDRAAELLERRRRESGR